MDLLTIPNFCINLDFQTDRWEKCKKEFSKVNIEPIRFSASYFTGINPYPSMNIRTAGCYDSHIKIWKRCIEEDLKLVGIFEDDILLPSDFNTVLESAFAELPEDFDIWQLHSCHCKSKPLNKYISIINSGGWGTHGYYITNNGCKKMLSIIPQKPIDFTMTTTFQNIGGKLYGTNNEYCLCFQSGDYSNNISANIHYWRSFKDRYYR